MVLYTLTQLVLAYICLATVKGEGLQVVLKDVRSTSVDLYLYVTNETSQNFQLFIYDENCVDESVVRIPISLSQPLYLLLICLQPRTNYFINVNNDSNSIITFRTKISTINEYLNETTCRVVSTLFNQFQITNTMKNLKLTQKDKMQMGGKNIGELFICGRQTSPFFCDLKESGISSNLINISGYIEPSKRNSSFLLLGPKPQHYYYAKFLPDSDRIHYNSLQIFWTFLNKPPDSNLNIQIRQEGNFQQFLLPPGTCNHTFFNLKNGTKYKISIFPTQMAVKYCVSAIRWTNDLRPFKIPFIKTFREMNSTTVTLSWPSTVYYNGIVFRYLIRIMPTKRCILYQCSVCDIGPIKNKTFDIKSVHCDNTEYHNITQIPLDKAKVTNLNSSLDRSIQLFVANRAGYSEHQEVSLPFALEVKDKSPTNGYKTMVITMVVLALALVILIIGGVALFMKKRSPLYGKCFRIKKKKIKRSFPLRSNSVYEDIYATTFNITDFENVGPQLEEDIEETILECSTFRSTRETNREIVEEHFFSRDPGPKKPNVFLRFYNSDFISESNYEETGNDYAVYCRRLDEMRSDDPPTYEEVADLLPALPGPMPIQKMTLKLDLLQLNHQYVQDFKLLGRYSNSDQQRIGFTTEQGMDYSNINKNRFSFIVPYDQTRVILKDDINHYINASYVTGYFHSKEFIATQGPMEFTVEDFWTMVMEQNTKIIVNLTKLQIEDDVICFKYWPIKGRAMTYQSVKVKTLEEKSFENLTIRSIVLMQNGISMSVNQLHFYAWSDKSEPNLEELNKLFDTFRKIRKQIKSDTIIVHDCAGIGQTGSFILLNNLLDEIEDDDSNNIDIDGAILKIRRCRPLLVNSPLQYLFVHKFLKFWLQGRGYLQTRRKT